MSLTKTQTIAGVEILDTREIQVRYSITVQDGDEILSKKTHYEVFAVGADLTGQDPMVQAAAAAAWTPETMAAKTAQIVAQSQAETVTRNAATSEAQAAQAASEKAKAEADAAKADHDAAAAQAASSKAIADDLTAQAKVALDQATATCSAADEAIAKAKAAQEALASYGAPAA